MKIAAASLIPSASEVVKQVMGLLLLAAAVYFIGAGINGAGIARDLAGRGLSVVLAEQHDLARLDEYCLARLGAIMHDAGNAPLALGTHSQHRPSAATMWCNIGKHRADLLAP